LGGSLRRSDASFAGRSEPGNERPKRRAPSLSRHYSASAISYSFLDPFDIPALSQYCLPMESLHAPWRIEYILAPKTSLPESLFAHIAQSADDEANYVIARDRTCFALLNTYPYTGGHLLVVPYKQTPDLYGLMDEEMNDLLK